MAGEGPTAPRELTSIQRDIADMRRLHEGLMAAGLAASYEAAHARLALQYLATTLERLWLLSAKKLEVLPARERPTRH